jgi:two-component system CheB/CheR fusion protein
VARSGTYPLGIAAAMPPERLGRFFTANDDVYRVKREIRQMLAFAQQNIIADPPFTKLDVLLCRNLLIYLNATLQKQLFPMLHYSLKPGGLLLLGTSESIGTHAELFTCIDKRSRLHRRGESAPENYVAALPGAYSARLPIGAERAVTEEPVASGLDRVAARMLLRDLVPPTVLVRSRGDVVYVHGKTGQFLEPAEGSQPRGNIFNMARDGLQIHLLAAMRRAASGEACVRRGVPVKTDGGRLAVDLHVVPISGPLELRGLFRVSFENARPAAKVDDHAGDDRSEPPGRIDELEREIRYAEGAHQHTIDDLETANEELKTANEELQSTNEELQSSNEELETSKEEMQSLNEELQTVNAELQGKLEELSRANDDMKNLLNGTDIATVFLDAELRIKRFTDQVESVIPLIPSDVGRPIGDLASSLHYERLVDDARDVLRTLVFKETETQSDDGRWYLVRILPYRTTDNVIDGVVITIIDITKLRTLQDGQERARPLP